MFLCFINHSINHLLQIVYDVSNIVCVYVVPFQKSTVTGSLQGELEMQQTKLQSSTYRKWRQDKLWHTANM